MPCVSPDGTVTETAKKVLSAAVEEKSAEEIANTGLPLFRVRSSIRELVDAGLIESRNEKYKTTEKGKTKIV